MQEDMNMADTILVYTITQPAQHPGGVPFSPSYTPGAPPPPIPVCPGRPVCCC